MPQRAKKLFLFSLAVVVITGIISFAGLSLADDSTPPVLQSFSTSNSDGVYGLDAEITITAGFDEDLDPSSTMEVALDTGVAVTLDIVDGSTLSGIYVVGEDQNSEDLNVTGINSASVTDLAVEPNTSTDYAADFTALQLASLNLANLASLVVDTSAPVLVSAELDVNFLFLNFDSGMDVNFIPALEDFSVSSGSGIEVRSVQIAASRVTLLLGGEVVGNEDGLTVSYTPGDDVLRDEAGNLSAGFSDEDVDIFDRVPVLYQAKVDGDELMLVYSETLDGGSVPSTGAFTVRVNGSPVTISSVSISGTSVTIALAAAVTGEDTVNVTYIAGASPIQDSTGENAANLISKAVFNITDTCDIFVGDRPYGAVTAGNYVYVNDRFAARVSVIDANPASGSFNTVIASIPVGKGNEYSNVIGDYVYVSNYESGTVSVINADPASEDFNTVVSTLTVGLAPYYNSVVGTNLYISNFESSSVSVIDANPASGSFNTVIATIPMSSSPISSTATERYVYVNDGGDISVIDANPASEDFNTVIATVDVGNPKFSLFVGSYVYAHNRSSSTVSVIDADPASEDFNTVIATISVGSGNEYLAAVGTNIYAVGSTSNTVSVIDANPASGSFNTVIASIGSMGTPWHVSALGKKVYVSTWASPSVKIIDADPASEDFNTVIATVAMPGGIPYYSVVAGNTQYVLSKTDLGFVTAINGTTNERVNACAPFLNSITASSPDGVYETGDSITIVAQFSQSLASGSKLRITLDTGDIIDLTSISGSTLSGTYTVGAGDASPDLTVTAIETDTAYSQAVGSDGKIQTGFVVPSSPELTGDTYANLGDLKDIVIGSQPVEIAVGSEPYQIAAVGTLVYVANQGSDSVSVINSETNAVTATISVGDQPYGLAYNAVSKELYVANLKGHTVSVINADPASGAFNTVTHTISVGREPYYVASLGTKMYVTNNVSNTVSVINTATHTVSATVMVGVAPKGIKAHGTDIYVANFGSGYGGTGAAGTVSVIDSNTNTVTRSILAGSGPRGVAVSGSEVYVANFNDDTVSVISTDTQAVTHTIAVGDMPRGVLALGGKIYVENYGDASMSVIDTATHAVTATVRIGNTPAGMAAVGTDIYLSRFTDGLVSILDTTSNALTLSNTAPTLSTASANGATLTLTYDEDLDSSSVPDTTAFTVSRNGVTTQAYSVSISGAVVTLTLAAPVLAGETVLVSYAVPSSNKIQDSLAASSSALTNQPVTNSTAQESASAGGGGSGWVEGEGSPGSDGPASESDPAKPITDSNPMDGNSQVPGFVQFVSFFSKVLFLGQFDEQVGKLQQFLNAHGFAVSSSGFGSRGQESYYFGPKTQQALRLFQVRYGITPVSGIFGPRTKEVVDIIMEIDYLESVIGAAMPSTLP